MNILYILQRCYDISDQQSFVYGQRPVGIKLTKYKEVQVAVMWQNEIRANAFSKQSGAITLNRNVSFREETSPWSTTQSIVALLCHRRNVLVTTGRRLTRTSHQGAPPQLSCAPEESSLHGCNVLWIRLTIEMLYTYTLDM